MKKISALIFLFLGFVSFKTDSKQVIARQGQVSFFSYTTVENIEAKNNQVLSIVDLNNNEIAISMLMNAFVFKKSLMHEHFNESYIESDLYPKATFQGKILNFNPEEKGSQTKIVKGDLTIRNITKPVEIKSKVENFKGTYTISGEFQVAIQDFDIKIPPIVEPNIAKIITVKFRFEYLPYEK